MNPHIISSSLHTSLGRNSYDEIDERLFDSYLDISGNKALFTKSSFSSPILSEEDSDSSSSLKRSVIGTGRKVNKQSVLNRRLNDTAKLPLKKEESDSESESERSKNTKKSKSKKVNVPKDNESDKKQKNLYKTELCRNWEETGHCRYGVKCQYAHGSKDLRQVERHPKYKTQKCRTFHQTGSCPYGARCTFRHYDLPGDKEELSETSSVVTAEEEEDEEEEEQYAHYDDSEASSMFSAKNQKMLHPHWFGHNTSLNTASPLVDEGLMSQFSNTLLFDPEDSLLPSNAESLLPHELLFDLESPQEEKKPARCPLRDYVTLPNLSHFQMPQQENEAPASLCKGLFKPWLF